MKILFVLFIIILFVAAVIYGARNPAFSENEFPSSGIIEFKQFVERIHKEMPDEITAVTYNIGYGSAEKNNKPEVLSEEEVRKNLDVMVESLKELDPDIVFLQEVDFNAARTVGIDQMRYLAKSLAMPFAAYTVTWNKRYIPWPYWPPAVHFGRMLSGQAILSRFPIEG